MNVMVHSMKDAHSLRVIVQHSPVLQQSSSHALLIVSDPVRMEVLSAVQEKSTNFIFHTLHSNPVNHLQDMEAPFTLKKFHLSLLKRHSS